MTLARVVVAVLAGATLAGCAQRAESTAGVARPSTEAVELAPCPAPGYPASATADPRLPDLTLPCLGPGAAVALRRLTGTPTIVNLWASWCAPCRTELPAFVRLQRAAGSRLRVFGVASLDRLDAARAYAGDNVPFASVVDGDGELGRALGRRGLPVTVLVAADGRVADVYQGAPLTDRTLRALVRSRLGVDA